METPRKLLEKLASDIGIVIEMAIDEGRLGAMKKAHVGFALLLFDFGPNGNLAWISNAQRPDMIRALKEFIEKEGVDWKM